MSEKLKPCPFCGSKEINVFAQFAECQQCGAKTRWVSYPRAAIEAWNTRKAGQ